MHFAEASPARVPAVLALGLLAGCAASPVRPTEVGTEPVAAVLDDWHDAAAQADMERYFAHFARDGIFLGTDATERWTVDEFRAYARPHFEAGRAWAFRSVRRTIVIEGHLAYFDEDLATENLGPARGSGVLRHTPVGWRIVQYNLAITVPNENFAAVRQALELA
ncbi:MAG: nuclear transport factor 2 family protein, partial [Myxococcota bacterium]